MSTARSQVLESLRRQVLQGGSDLTAIKALLAQNPPINTKFLDADTQQTLLDLASANCNKEVSDAIKEKGGRTSAELDELINAAANTMAIYIPHRLKEMDEADYQKYLGNWPNEWREEISHELDKQLNFYMGEEMVEQLLNIMPKPILEKHKSFEELQKTIYAYGEKRFAIEDSQKPNLATKAVQFFARLGKPKQPLTPMSSAAVKLESRVKETEDKLIGYYHALCRDLHDTVNKYDGSDNSLAHQAVLERRFKLLKDLGKLSKNIQLKSEAQRQSNASTPVVAAAAAASPASAGLEFSAPDEFVNEAGAIKKIRSHVNAMEVLQNTMANKGYNYADDADLTQFAELLKAKVTGIKDVLRQLEAETLALQETWKDHAVITVYLTDLLKRIQASYMDCAISDNVAAVQKIHTSLVNELDTFKRVMATPALNIQRIKQIKVACINPADDTVVRFFAEEFPKRIKATCQAKQQDADAEARLADLILHLDILCEFDIDLNEAKSTEHERESATKLLTDLKNPDNYTFDQLKPTVKRILEGMVQRLLVMLSEAMEAYKIDQALANTQAADCLKQLQKKVATCRSVEDEKKMKDQWNKYKALNEHLKPFFEKLLAQPTVENPPRTAYLAGLKNRANALFDAVAQGQEAGDKVTELMEELDRFIEADDKYLRVNFEPCRVDTLKDAREACLNQLPAMMEMVFQSSQLPAAVAAAAASSSPAAVITPEKLEKIITRLQATDALINVLAEDKQTAESKSNMAQYVQEIETLLTTIPSIYSHLHQDSLDVDAAERVYEHVRKGLETLRRGQQQSGAFAQEVQDLLTKIEAFRSTPINKAYEIYLAEFEAKVTAAEVDAQTLQALDAELTHFLQLAQAMATAKIIFATFDPPLAVENRTNYYRRLAENIKTTYQAIASGSPAAKASQTNLINAFRMAVNQDNLISAIQRELNEIDLSQDHIKTRLEAWLERAKTNYPTNVQDATQQVISHANQINAEWHAYKKWREVGQQVQQKIQEVNPLAQQSDNPLAPRQIAVNMLGALHTLHDRVKQLQDLSTVGEMENQLAQLNNLFAIQNQILSLPTDTLIQTDQPQHLQEYQQLIQATVWNEGEVRGKVEQLQSYHTAFSEFLAQYGAIDTGIPMMGELSAPSEIEIARRQLVASIKKTFMTILEPPAPATEQAAPAATSAAVAAAVTSTAAASSPAPAALPQTAQQKINDQIQRFANPRPDINQLAQADQDLRALQTSLEEKQRALGLASNGSQRTAYLRRINIIKQAYIDLSQGVAPRQCVKNALDQFTTITATPSNSGWFGVRNIDSLEIQLSHALSAEKEAQIRGRLVPPAAPTSAPAPK